MPSPGLQDRPLIGNMFGMEDAEFGECLPRLLDESEIAALRRRGHAASFINNEEAAIFCVSRNGERCYPSFLVDPKLNRRHLVAVARLLEGWDNFTKWRFFVSGKGSLGGLTPLEALRQGKLREVKVAAEGFATR